MAENESDRPEYSLEENGFESLGKRTLWRDEAGVLYVARCHDPAGANELEQVQSIALLSDLIVDSQGRVKKNKWGPLRG